MQSEIRDKNSCLETKIKTKKQTEEGSVGTPRQEEVPGRPRSEYDQSHAKINQTDTNSRSPPKKRLFAKLPCVPKRLHNNLVHDRATPSSLRHINCWASIVLEQSTNFLLIQFIDTQMKSTPASPLLFLPLSPP